MSFFGRLFRRQKEQEGGTRIAVGSRETWAEATSGSCDVCGGGIPPDSGARLIPNAEFTALVDAGFNPATTGRLGPAAQLSLEMMFQGDPLKWHAHWKATVVQPDTTDWALCRDCLAALGSG
jgi:hypothetical protein